MENAELCFMSKKSMIRIVLVAAVLLLGAASGPYAATAKAPLRGDGGGFVTVGEGCGGT